jgi:hypothetical protein
VTTLIDFIDDPAILGPHFEGPSWDRWRAVLKATFALPMTERDLALFREVAGDRTPPTKPVRELVAAVGRGGGKDSIAAALAAYIAATGDFSRLRPGERGTVLTLAVDRPQASIAFNYVRGYFEQVPLLSALVERIGDDFVDLKTGAEVVVGTNSMRSVRGRTIAAAIYDEVAFWRDDAYANPDAEVDAAVSPGLMRFPGSLKILISSVHRRSGLLYDRVAQHYGKDGDDVLVVMGESLQFNETLDRAEIERQLAADYERAAAEYLSKWRDDLTNFLDRALIEAATDPGVVVRPPQPGVRYIAFTDPSGGRGDSFACAIAHVEGNAIVLDALYERRAPFDPTTVVADIAALLRSYGLSEVTGDRYAAEWVVSGFAREGITYRASERDKSSIFLDVLPLFTSGRIRILDEPRLHHQLIALERRTTRTGRDIVSHPDHQNAHDDLANAMAGAATLAASEAGPALWRHANLLTGDAPVAWPPEYPTGPRVASVFATAAVDDRGVVVAYWGAGGKHHGGSTCLLIDYENPSLYTADFWPRINARIAELAGQMVLGRSGNHAALGGLIVTAALAGPAFAAGAWLRADGEALLQHRDTLLLACAAEIGKGEVRITSLADERSRTAPLIINEVRKAAPESAAQDTALLGITGTLDLATLPVGAYAAA